MANNFIFEQKVRGKHTKNLQQHLTTIFGTAGTRIELINGAYIGNIIIGVKYDPKNMENPGLPHNTKRFLVGLYLSDGVSIKYPSRSQCTPLWRMADANQTFDTYDSGDIPERYGSEQ